MGRPEVVKDKTIFKFNASQHNRPGADFSHKLAYYKTKCSNDLEIHLTNNQR